MSEEIAAKLQVLDPRVRLVSPKWLRRIIRRHREMSASSRPAPHEIGYWIPSQTLLQYATPQELGVEGFLPETVLLLPHVEGEESKVLTQHWRAMFHLAIDQTMDQKPNDEEIKLFIRKLGGTTWQEIREVVLDQELLFDDPTDRDILREFAAFFLELKYFQPEWLSVYFPGINDPAAMEEMLNEFVAASDFFACMRPEGAAGTVVVAKEIESEVTPEDQQQPTPVDPASVQAPDEVRRVGNDVRAAVLFIKTGKIAEAEACLKSLILRLQKALASEAYEEWWQSLRPLLDRASTSYWPRELRLLYELQKICVDHEKGLYSVELMEWVITLGKHPIKRKLEKPQEVNELRYLRRADKHLQFCRLETKHREKISHRLSHEMHAAEKRIRDDFTPILHETLDEVGVKPANIAEKISRDKLVAELIDVICARGFLKFSDIRDAIARNRLKLEDQTVKEFITGDALLQINRKLPYKLDGVYHRGEIYLRLMQRISAIFFGTLLGRMFTKFVALPFGGAYLILEAIGHMLHAFEGGIRFVTGESHRLAGLNYVPVNGNLNALAKELHLDHASFATLPAVGLFGIFLLLVIHWPWFRWQVAKGMKEVLIDTPRRILNAEFLQKLFDNPFVKYFFRFLFVPILCGIVAALLVHGIFELPWLYCWLIGAGFGLFVGSFFRTSLGRGMEERFNDTVNDAWRLFSSRLLLGVLTAILNFFKAIFEWIEKTIYSVDEMLRFREGDSVLSYYFKMVFGFFWFVFTYLFRLTWTLFGEPQINPIKHFPVVTVSHKLLLPLIPNLAELFGTSIGLMTFIVGMIPGIFGFLAWEFKENWKLYRANRPRELKSVSVGSHGESLRGLLRPGFHSGIVPKTYRKLRDGTTQANPKKIHKAEYQLHHAEEALHHLVEREFLSYLKASKRWKGLPIHLKEIQLGTNRVRMVLEVAAVVGASSTSDGGIEHLTIGFEQRNGWMIASLEEFQAFKHWSPAQQAAFLDALTGLYKLCGIHLIREQLKAALHSEAFATDCNLEALIVPTRTEPVIYTYNDRDLLQPLETENSLAKPIPREEVLFNESSVEWERWAVRWESDLAGESPTEPLVKMKMVR